MTRIEIAISIKCIIVIIKPHNPCYVLYMYEFYNQYKCHETLIHIYYLQNKGRKVVGNTKH